MPLEKRILIAGVTAKPNGQLLVQFVPSIIDTDNNDEIISQNPRLDGVCEAYTPIAEFIAARCGPLLAQGYQVADDEGKAVLDRLVASEHTPAKAAAARARADAGLEAIPNRNRGGG